MPIKTKVEDVKLSPNKYSWKDQFVKKVDPGPPKRLTILVYGATGAGKTFFSGTFPKPLFLDMRGGVMTVRKKDVSAIYPQTYTEILQAAIYANVKDFSTIVVDTMTEAARIVMQDALKMSGRELPQLQDWSLVIERLRKLCVAFTDPGMLPDQHIIFTAEEDTRRDEETGKLFGGPNVPGKMFHEMGTFFDCVFHLRSAFHPTRKVKERLLLTEPDGIYPAKDRTGCFEKLEIPDFKVLWEKVSKS